MDIDKSMIVKEFVNCEREGASKPEHTTECIGTWTKMSYGTKELEGMSFLLKRVACRI
jgi:hypothetical protein